MTMTIEYIGTADARVIHSAAFTAAGFPSQGTTTWNKANGYEVDVPDNVGLWLTSFSDFRYNNESFGAIVPDWQGWVANLPEMADGTGTAVDDSVEGFVGIDRTFRQLLAKNNVTGTTDATLLGAALSLPAGLVKTNYEVALVLEMIGTYLNNSGAPADATFKVKLGGFSTIVFPFTAIPAGAQNRPWFLNASVAFAEFGGTRAYGGGRMSMGAVNSSGADLGTLTRLASLSDTYNLANALGVDVTVQHTAGSNINAASITGSIRLMRRKVD